VIGIVAAEVVILGASAAVLVAAGAVGASTGAVGAPASAVGSEVRAGFFAAVADDAPHVISAAITLAIRKRSKSYSAQ
jgi:hypothetical protein